MERPQDLGPRSKGSHSSTGIQQRALICRDVYDRRYLLWPGPSPTRALIASGHLESQFIKIRELRSLCVPFPIIRIAFEDDPFGGRCDATTNGPLETTDVGAPLSSTPRKAGPLFDRFESIPGQHGNVIEVVVRGRYRFRKDK
jgi:hypothetical protein